MAVAAVGDMVVDVAAAVVVVVTAAVAAVIATTIASNANHAGNSDYTDVQNDTALRQLGAVSV